MWLALSIGFIGIISLLEIEAQVDDPQAHVEFWNDIGRKHLEKKYKYFEDFKHRKLPKNIVLMLGDGMGLPIITSGRIYRNQKDKEPNLFKPHYFEGLDATGIVKTHSYDYFVTDSAASAMALTAGRKIEQEMLGMQPISTRMCEDSHDPIRDSIVDLALASGKAVGFVTTTRLTHASPASLYAKKVFRNAEAGPVPKDSKCQDIGSQLLSNPAKQFKVMLGAGKRYLTSSPEGKRQDGRDIVEEWKQLDGKRSVVYTKDELSNANPSDTEFLMGLFHGDFLEYEINEKEKTANEEPGIVDMVAKAVEFMEHNNENGYFLFIEGGLIDVAEHYGITHMAFGELRAFDDAVKKVRESTNPEETLVLVTADHSHALAISGYTKVNQSILDGSFIDQANNTKNLKVSAMNFVSGPQYKDKRTNLTEEEINNKTFKTYSHVYADIGSHGGDDVAIYASGPFAWLFTGVMENTEIAYTMKHLLCVKGSDWNACGPSSENPLNNIDQQITEGGSSMLVIVLVVVMVVALVALIIAALLFLVLTKKKKKISSVSSNKSVSSNNSVSDGNSKISTKSTKSVV